MKNGLFDRLLSSIERLEGDQQDLSQYRDNPVRFGEEILQEQFTDDVKAMMRSVLNNPVTIAKSANATGKTHGAARVAI